MDETIAIHRRPSQPIQIGNVTVGGTAPVSVQSMTNTPTQDVNATVSQIQRLEAAGLSIPYPQTDVHLHKVQQGD